MIQNCIGISWTKSNTRQLTQNNEVIAETTEYQTPSRSAVSLKKNIKVPPFVTPFVIINFSHHEHLHLPKDHVVAFAEKDCSEGEVLEICTMEQLEKDLPRNWIPERK